jgi:hypothetical protein
MWKSFALIFAAIAISSAVADPLGEAVPETALPPAAKQRLAEVRKQEMSEGRQDYKLIKFLKCKVTTVKSLALRDKLDFELETKFTCIREPSSGQDMTAYNWIGRTNDKNSQCVISVTNNYVVGSLVYGDAKKGTVTRYSLKTLSVDKQFVWVRVGLNQSRRKQGASDVPRFAEVTDASEVDADVTADTTINVQFGFTAKASQESGGDDRLKAKIANALSVANVALRNSRTNVQLKSVGVLKTKTNDGDGVPEVSPLLNSMVTDKTTKWTDLWGAAKNNKADLISLVTARTLRCGAAKMGGAGVPVAVGYAVMYINNAHINWDNCFGHEIAHMFGCDHDIKTLGGTASAAQNQAKNLGYVYSSTTWRTVMAYPNAGSFDTPAKAPYYSDPNINYMSKPTGNAVAQCAAVLRKNVAAIAKLRTQR